MVIKNHFMCNFKSKLKSRFRVKFELKQLQLRNFLYQNENYCECYKFFINVITDNKPEWLRTVHFY